MFVLISIVIIFFTTVFLYFYRIFTYWKRREIPTVRIRLPYGNFRPVALGRCSIGENSLQLYRKLKVPGRRFAGIYFFTKPELMILDPELAKTILTKDFQYFSGRGLNYDEENDPLTAHLVALEGKKWKDMRQKLTPTFSSGKIKTMFNTIVSCSTELQNIMDKHVVDNEPIDIKELAGRFTMDIIGSCAFGLDCNTLKDPNVEFYRFGKKVFKPSTFLWMKKLLSFTMPKIFKTLGLTKTDKEVEEFFMNIVQETVTYREQNNIKRNDFLQLLINVRNYTEDSSDISEKEKSGKSLSIEQIAAQSFLFFLAGFETSSTAMTFFFYHMAMNQHIQEKVKKEIDDMMKKYDGKLTYDGISELHYLDKVLNESLRHHPPVPILHRKCNSDYKIPDSDTIIEKGTVVIIPGIGFQYDAEYYPEPEKFDPERFSYEEKEKRHSFVFLPFGEGPRNCIGLRFGLLQSKVGIVALLKNHRFKLHRNTKTPLRMVPKSVLFTVESLWLTPEKL